MRSTVRLILSLILFAFFAVGGAAAWVWFTLPDASLLVRNYPVVVPKGSGVPPEIRFSTRRPSGWVPLKEISPHARAAILISEDGKFYQHKGVDIEELKLALKQDLKAMEFKRGASTITQQLVKNVFLTREKSLLRKLQELILTMRLEELLPKYKILENYLNVIEYGPNLYGIGRASRHYFQKHPGELNAKEGAFLAMLLPSPVRYSASFRQKELTPYAKKIIRMLLRKMVILGHLTAEEAEAQWESPLAFEEVVEPSEPTLDDSEAADEAEGPEAPGEDSPEGSEESRALDAVPEEPAAAEPAREASRGAR